MSKRWYKTKLSLLQGVSLLAIMLLAAGAFGVDLPVPTPQELASWPASVVLGAVCIVATTIAYKSWMKVFDLQKSVTQEIAALREELAARPCILNGHQK